MAGTYAAAAGIPDDPFSGGFGFGQRVLVASIGHWLINIAVYLAVGDDTLGSPQVGFIAVAAVVAAAGVVTARVLRRGQGTPLR